MVMCHHNQRDALFFLQFKKQTDATTTAANLVALINSNATTKLVVYATNVAGVVTVTCCEPGQAGNFVTLATSNSSGFGLGGSVLAGGVGGGDMPAISYSRGL